MEQADVLVIGAGTVGAAIGYGLAKRGLQVLVLDGGDTDFRAARANFGLVWVQGKGMDMPAYQMLSRDSSDLWPEFLDQLRQDAGGLHVDYERRGGLAFCLGEDELEQRRNRLMRLHNQLGTDAQDVEILERSALEKLLPGVQLGPEIAGASYCWRDGHVNPLQLLQGLHQAIRRLGGRILPRHEVGQIDPSASGFTVHAGGARFAAPRLVIAAGIATGVLAGAVGLSVPVRPQRGQVLVTQRLAPFLPLPCSGVRQTAEGTVMIGATQEEVGADISTTAAAAGRLARRASRILPALADVQLVRQWAGLRVMTPDGYPVYSQSEVWPGAFAAVCHSGVTLAALHAQQLAGHIAGGTLPDSLQPFHERRFHVPAA